MRTRKLLTGLGSLALLSGLFVFTAAATPAATNTAKFQRVQQTTLVGHTAYAPSPTNLTAGAKGYTQDLNRVRGTPRPPNDVGMSAAPLLARGAATSVKGLNAFQLAADHGFVVEPPDQGLCAGNGFVVEMVNLNLQVFNASLIALAGPMVLETFFGQPIAFGFNGGDVTIQGDPRCYYDANTRRWFLSQLYLDLNTSVSEFNLAVSTTSSPMDPFNLYSLSNTDKFNPGCPCFGDQPTMGANNDAIFISTNEFSINGPTFNGAVVYAIDKQALASGAVSANTVVGFVGLMVPTPGQAKGSCTTSNGLFCWASLRPTTSPTSGETRFGGVEYLLSALDFANTKDNRIALFAVTNTSSIRSNSPAIGFRQAILTSENYVFPNLARQKAGPIPLGDSGLSSCGAPCTEGLVQTNDDQIQNSVFANGMIWGALTTNMPMISQARVGSAWFVVMPNLTSTGLTATIAKQGYLVVAGNNVIFPSVGIDSAGKGLVSVTLTGKDFFPTSAYATLNASGAGAVQIAALGMSPQDSFTEYESFGTPFYRPRWGDYTAAVPVGTDVYFASEYIQSPNCSDVTFASDSTCGGTRSQFANWGTSLNKLSVA